MKYMFKILVKETKLVVRLLLLIDKDFKIYFNVSPKGRGLFSMLSPAADSRGSSKSERY